MFDIIQKKYKDLRIPILAGIALTHRCNQRCLYCRVWDTRTPELKTKQVLSIIDELAALGTRRFCLTGGEPLLRDDIGRIINFASRKNMFVEVSSNGALVKEKISELANVDVLCLSLDGPEHIHDRIRGNGSFKKVIEAAGILKKNGINVYFRSVISKKNLACINAIMDIAKKFRISFIFQPASPLLLGTNHVNPLAASADEYREVFDRLIIEKKKNSDLVLNSLAGLRYFHKYLHIWPKPKRISCISGRLLFHIEPNGMLYPCINGCHYDIRCLGGISCLKSGVEKAVRNLPETICSGCWNAATFELNNTISVMLKKKYSTIHIR